MQPGRGSRFCMHTDWFQHRNQRCLCLLCTQEFPQAQVTGVDLSPHFLAVAELEERCVLTRPGGAWHAHTTLVTNRQHVNVFVRLFLSN